MAGVSGTLADTVVAMLASTTNGVDVRVRAINNGDDTLAVTGLKTIIALNASVEISDKVGYVQYPALVVYCDKLSNTLKEKFRHFSGKAHVVVEVRHSQDTLPGLDATVQVYTDAVCALLDDSRGDWGSGLFYGGGYEVNFEPMGRGGRNFLQIAEVEFDVEVSK